MFDLTGKSAVVTGGGTGIGRGIVRALAACGAGVVVAGRTVETLEETVAEVTDKGGRAIAVRADIGSADDLAALAAAATETFGWLDTWVNNAGSAEAGDVGPLLSLTESQWDAVVDLNLKATFFACQTAARAMAERGGSIINITSRSASQPNPMTGQYGASKAGVENLTLTMAVEWGHLGIRVNAVAPGLVLIEKATAPGGAMSKQSRIDRQARTVPLRRLGVPDDVGPLCAYLASDEASWVSGEVIQVHGGSRIPVGYLTYLHHVNERLDRERGSTDGDG